MTWGIDPRAEFDAPVRNARDTFTNRVNELKRFTDLVQSHDTPMPLLMFYGVGGAGKTQLLERLQRECETLGVPWAGISLAEFPTPFVALLDLYKQLNKRHQWKFKRFEIIVAVIQARFGTQGLDNPQQGDKALKGTDVVLDGLALIPVVGILAQIAKLIKNTSEIVAQEKIKALLEGTNALTPFGGDTAQYLKLLRMDAEKLEEKLLSGFAADLLETAPNRNGPQGRCALFFDTHEHLTYLTNEGAKTNDHWIQDLRRLLDTSKIQMVMAGRDQLKWADHWQTKDDQGRYTRLEQHVVGGLSRADALEYLYRTDVNQYPADPFIMPTDLQEAILNITNEAAAGQPSAHLCYFLALCVEIVANTKRANKTYPNPEVFKDIPNDDVGNALVKRFLQSLPDDRSRVWLTDLSLTPRFNKGFLFGLETSGTRKHALTEADWLRLTNLSMLEKTSSGLYQFHKLFRASLLKLVEEVVALAVHKFAKDYWTGQAQTADGEEMRLAWYHHRFIDYTAAMIDFEKRWGDARQYAQAQTLERLLQWWDDVSFEIQPSHPESANDCLNFAGRLLETSLGNRSERLIKNIELNTSTFHFYAEIQDFEGIARTQYQLGRAYSDLPVGNQAQNLKKAIQAYYNALAIYTKTDYPAHWAMTQVSLGLAYSNLPIGNQAQNLKKAIQAYYNALEIYTKTDYATHWAGAQINLGVAYSNLPIGNQERNFEKAIQAYYNALEIYTKTDYPFSWAKTQIGLGNAYSSFPTGDQAQNLKKAIQAYYNALEIFTKTDYPDDWAMTQNNLGLIYSNFPTGDQERNFEEAIQAYYNALEIYTKTEYPFAWAKTQYNLGLAYCILTTGDKAQNLEEAIQAYYNALEIHTKTDYPTYWAKTQYNLGLAYANLAKFKQSNDFSQTRVCWTNAKDVFLEIGMPDEAQELSRWLKQLGEE